MSKQFLDELSDLWRREWATTRLRHEDERANTTLVERVARGVALAGVEVVETAAAPGDRTLLWVRPPLASGHSSGRASLDLEDFRAGPGTPVVLWWDALAPSSSVPAVLARRRDDMLGIMVDGAPDERLIDGPFNVDVEAPRTTFERGLAALEALLAAPERSDIGGLRLVLTGAEPPARRRPVEWRPLDPELNDAQKQAVACALGAQELALVHGPPGTGKTRTLVEVVRQSLARGERVLVTAASNAAVDNIAERLIDAQVELVRVGHPARVAPAVERRTLDALLEATPDYGHARRWVAEANELRRRTDARNARGQLSRAERRAAMGEVHRLLRDARKHLRNMQAAIVDRSRVVCATAVGADAMILEGQQFDCVVLDEATQAPDPIALVAMLRARKVVMAGDPHQLPPTVIDLQCEREGLGRTFFERLAEHATMLTVQHRMHASLMAFPSASKYGGQLVAAPGVERHVLEELEGVAPDPLRPGPLVFIDTAGKGWDEERSADDPSTRNPGQAERTVAEARRLLGRGLRPDDLAIITPYDAQARLLRERLAAEGIGGVEVGTVDGFQGREKEAIVVDLVRSNPDGELGFLADTRRMNVALTRARRFLLVIGDSATLSGHPYYAQFFEAVERQGAWISAWADDAT